jgi:hypothetical protein
MQLSLLRKTYDDTSTIGELMVDGEFQCYVLEDRVRAEGVKVKGQTAIPAGSYDVLMTFSNRFQKVMPLINAVPNFDGVRIHPGNTSADTEGCLLVGKTEGKDFIGSSVVAFNELFPRMKHAFDAGEGIQIEIVDDVPDNFLL